MDRCNVLLAGFGQSRRHYCDWWLSVLISRFVAGGFCLGGDGRASDASGSVNV